MNPTGSVPVSGRAEVMLFPCYLPALTFPPSDCRSVPDLTVVDKTCHCISVRGMYMDFVVLREMEGWGGQINKEGHGAVKFNS